MNKKYMILPLLLVFLFASGLSLGQSANNTSIAENNSSAMENATILANLTVPANESSLMNATTPANESALMNMTAPANETVQGNETAAAATEVETGTGPNLNYIWSFSGIEAGPVTMVLDQDGNDLFGQAKYETDAGSAWNADVIGSVAGNEVELTMSAQKDNGLTTTKMSGIFKDEAITGNFTQVSGGKIVNKGTFSATWINPDTSSYTPATIEEPIAAASAPEVASTTDNAAATTDDTAAAEKPASRFYDVHEYADKLGPGGDLSGVPPGMGGGGGP